MTHRQHPCCQWNLFSNPPEFSLHNWSFETKDFQRHIRLILTTTQLEKQTSKDQTFSASGSNLARGDHEACLDGSQLWLMYISICLARSDTAFKRTLNHSCRISSSVLCSIFLSEQQLSQSDLVCMMYLILHFLKILNKGSLRSEKLWVPHLVMK